MRVRRDREETRRGKLGLGDGNLRLIDVGCYPRATDQACPPRILCRRCSAGQETGVGPIRDVVGIGIEDCERNRMNAESEFADTCRRELQPQ